MLPAAQQAKNEPLHLEQADEVLLKGLIAQHAELTGSPRAKSILADWDSYRGKFVKVYPNEYRRALKELAAAKQQQKEIA